MENETKLLVTKSTLLKIVSMVQTVKDNLEGFTELTTVAQELKTEAQSLLDSVVSAHEAM